MGKVIKDCLPAGVGVQDCFSRRKGLANNNEQSLVNLEPMNGPLEIRRVNIGQKPQREAL